MVEVQPQFTGVQAVIFFVQMLQIKGHPARGVRKGRGRAFQTDAKGIVGAGQRGGDVVDLKPDVEPFPAAKQIAVQPVAGQVQPFQS